MTVSERNETIDAVTCKLRDAAIIATIIESICEEAYGSREATEKSAVLAGLIYKIIEAEIERLNTTHDFSVSRLEREAAS